MLYKVVLTFGSVNETLMWGQIQVVAIEQYSMAGFTLLRIYVFSNHSVPK